MKKIKLLIMACALLGVGQAWAQTDVTSTYITNADFEGTYTRLNSHFPFLNTYQGGTLFASVPP